MILLTKNIDLSSIFYSRVQLTELFSENLDFEEIIQCDIQRKQELLLLLLQMILQTKPMITLFAAQFFCHIRYFDDFRYTV
jgi:hypothetical protein